MYFFVQLQLQIHKYITQTNELVAIHFTVSIGRTLVMQNWSTCVWSILENSSYNHSIQRVGISGVFIYFFIFNYWYIYIINYLFSCNRQVKVVVCFMDYHCFFLSDKIILRSFSFSASVTADRVLRLCWLYISWCLQVCYQQNQICFGCNHTILHYL